MEKGIVVLLNGTSSAGKTSIAMEMMKQKEVLFHHLSVDDFFHNYNEFIDNKFPDMEPVRHVDDSVVGDIIFDPIVSMLYATVRLFSEMGLHVIVDTVMENDKWFNDCLDAFADLPTLLVGVICSREELKRREQVRGDRRIGLANEQFDHVYSFDEYDIEVNTEQLNPTQCAEAILNVMNSQQNLSAFKKLSKRPLDCL
ncbi:chloramphenicol phosphotransferase CPT family protein [Paenibacillus wenxiniae]|uniref:Chloramphenicol phosphotransferase CPT family protein n=1 Tax=Paenibacillus wenxiniae TaxID=1636843 RepID=A0ABW4RPN1_9BACL